MALYHNIDQNPLGLTLRTSTGREDYWYQCPTGRSRSVANLGREGSGLRRARSLSGWPNPYTGHVTGARTFTHPLSSTQRIVSQPLLANAPKDLHLTSKYLPQWTASSPKGYSGGGGGIGAKPYWPGLSMCGYRSSVLSSPFNLWYPPTWSNPAQHFQPAEFASHDYQWRQRSDLSPPSANDCWYHPTSWRKAFKRIPYAMYDRGLRPLRHY